jgi:hypothetical protein
VKKLGEFWMKTKLLLCLAALFLVATTNVFAADENDAEARANDSESVVAMCENQYTAETYPDEEERDKLIDQCISENSPAPAE